MTKTQIASAILLLCFPAPASSAWGAESPTEAPKKTLNLDVKWPPKTSLKGVVATSVLDGLQDPMSITENFSRNLREKLTKSLGCKWSTTVGGVACSLNTTALFPGTKPKSEAVPAVATSWWKRTSSVAAGQEQEQSEPRANGISLEKKIGSVCCSLDTSSNWPLQPTAGIRGSVDAGEAGTICYDLKTPISRNTGNFATLGDVSGSVTWKKEIGDAMCSLETPPVYPLKPSASIKKKIGPVCCKLTAPIDLDAPADIAKSASASATYSKTFDTDIGPVCCSVDGDVAASGQIRATGTAALKKKIGAVCANLEANTKGEVKCTFENAWDGLAETETGVPKFTSLAIGALAGACAGTFITLTLLRRRRWGLNHQPLLDA